MDLNFNRAPESRREKRNERLRRVALELAAKWKERKRKPDLIFFFSVRDRFSPALADLPLPMMAKNEIPILKEIAAVLDEAGVEFTRAQVRKRIEELKKIAPKEAPDAWVERKDLF